MIFWCILLNCQNALLSDVMKQGWETCGPRAKCSLCEHLIWPASEISLPKM